METHLGHGPIMAEGLADGHRGQRLWATVSIFHQDDFSKTIIIIIIFISLRQISLISSPALGLGLSSLCIFGPVMFFSIRISLDVSSAAAAGVSPVFQNQFSVYSV